MKHTKPKIVAQLVIAAAIAALIGLSIVLLMQRALRLSDGEIAEIDRMVNTELRQQWNASEIKRIPEIFRVSKSGKRKEGDFQYLYRGERLSGKAFVHWRIESGEITIQSIRTRPDS